MSMLFSGFATRQQQQLYDSLVEQLISVLSKRVSKIYEGAQCNEQAFKMVLLKIMVNLNILEEKKYATPKLSQQVKDLMGLLQLDYVTSQSQQQNGVIKTKKKEYQLLNQSDLISKKANFIANKQRSITPMNGVNPSKTNKNGISSMHHQPQRVNSSNANNGSHYSNQIQDGQLILPPQTAIGGDKNGFRVKLYNKNEESLYGPVIQLKSGYTFEESNSKNTIQSYDTSKELQINSKDTSQYINCYESINVKKTNHTTINPELTQESNQGNYYQPYQPDHKTYFSQKTNEVSTLSPHPPQSKFENSFEVLLEKIQDQNPQMMQKADLNYNSISAHKGYSQFSDLECPQPSQNFPSESKSIQNNYHHQNQIKNNFLELNNEKESTMIDQDIIKKIINIQPQIGKLNKQEKSIDRSFRKLRKKSQQNNTSIANNNSQLNNSSVQDAKTGFDLELDKLEQEFYYGNNVNSATSANSQRFSDTARSNRKNGFFSAQRNNYK